jgi:hypothetical protein
VQVRSFFLFPVMPMRVVSGKSKLMRVELRTGILRLRALIDGILFWGEEKVLNMREITSANPVVPLKRLLALNLLCTQNVNLMCNNLI